LIDDLPPQRASLARDTLAWCEPWWDDERSLAWAPPGADVGRVHLVPQSGWYAYGLLLRGEQADRERAARCLAALIDLQYDEPGTPWHGSFARWAEAPHPPDDAVMWLHYDPNWRQFLGTTFIALLQDFEPQLDSALVSRLDAALQLAVQGEPAGRVPAAYSNIALMKAFLEVEAGTRLGEPAWVRSGESLASEIADAFEARGCFEEYNSPTYYGIDFHALALWSQRSSSDLLRRRGAALEAGLWRDVSRWYHAGLRNLCGPYSRTYGMDMTRYVALLGLDIWAAVGHDRAPLPPFDPGVDHGHDFFLGPLAAALGVRVPDDAIPALSAFPGEHEARQVIASEPGRVATGWLADDLMIGAERHEGGPPSSWRQYVTASVHWRLPNGDVGWIRVRARGPSSGTAAPHSLNIELPPSREARELRVLIHAPGLDAAGLGKDRWHLPGLDVSLQTNLSGPRLELDASPASATFEVLVELADRYLHLTAHTRP
jgi:hypothetical protein